MIKDYPPVIGLNYQPKNLFISFSGIYGSGLTNGNSDYVFKTGLFDFNQERIQLLHGYLIFHPDILLI